MIANGESTAPDRASVSVVVPTHRRPALVQAAVRSVVSQDYAGSIETIVVFDQCEPHAIDVATAPDRPITILVNDARSPGLAGARNTGILAATGDYVAFCDDDDEWMPRKLSAQMAMLDRHAHDDPAVSTGVYIVSDGRTTARPGPRRVLGFTDFLDDRIMEVNPCTLMVRRTRLLDEVGLVDECIPGSYAEDYELLLRTTRVMPVVNVAEPLVRIAYHSGSFYASRWRTIIDGLTYLLGKYPEFVQRPRGYARILGQMAFATAALRDRSRATRYVWGALRRNPLEQRAWVALLVVAGLRAEFVVNLARRFGRGI